MRCEVVAIGTELLLGQIIDTNSSWIGEQLALAGIDSHFQVKVGDNLERMEFCLRQALDRSDAVICCGGLGPTQDDITRDAIAKVMGVNLKRDETIVDKILSTSPPKSACPGVSTIFMCTPCQRNPVFFDRIVIPLSRSNSLLSMTLASSFSVLPRVPESLSNLSTSVVFPWSTWAIMAILRMF